MCISKFRRVEYRSGLPKCTNLSLLVYIFLFLDISRGIGSKSLLWFRSVARCHLCTAKVTHQRGIICANFGERVLGLPPCHTAWCATCYKIHPGIAFFIYRAKDEEGEDMMAPGEEKDFLEARPGDHLFCPFECDFCVFFRLRGESPVSKRPEDERLLAYIRRANLDAFWSRRPGTIHGLVNLFREQTEVGEEFGFQMFPSPGPFHRQYDSGMKAAVGILWRSRRPGLHEATMKYSSVRKARTLHTDFYNASATHADGVMTWRSDRTRFVATQAPTETEWFNHFMTGLKARIGERRKQDAAMPIGVMVQIQSTLESDWEHAVELGDLPLQRTIAEHGAYYLAVFCGSLRGFEGPKINLGDTRRQIVRPDQVQIRKQAPHVGLAITGRFKKRDQHVRTILIPIAYTTASGLQPGTWIDRLIAILDRNGIRTGWMFQDHHGDQLRMSHFEEDFYDRLTRISQSSPELFTDGINVLEDFHLARSFRRGATTRATAAGVSARDIDFINRWNQGADTATSGVMQVVYSDTSQLIDTYLRFSLAL